MNVNKLIIGLVCLVMFSSGCLTESPAPSTHSSESPPKVFEKLDLYFSEPPEFNKPVELTMDVVYGVPYLHPNATIKIDLTDGFEFVSGDLEWQGDFTKDVPVQLKAVVKPVKTGEWVIRGWVIYGEGGSMMYTPLYVSVSEDSVEVSKTSPPVPVVVELKRVQ